MADLTLNAQPREVTGKQVKRLRRAGTVPAVVYGPAVSGPRSIQLDYKAFEAVYGAAGLSRLITLSVGGGAGQPVFIRDVQYNLLKRRVDHVDFYAAKMDVETTAAVPVVLVGEAPVATRDEGVVTQVLTSVTVRALPRAIPAHLEVDASAIETLDDDVRVADLRLPPDVTVVDNPDAIVISVTRMRVEEPELVEAEEPAAEAEGADEAAEADEPTAEAVSSDEDNA
jgi:large subunit ribosomal protein L25